MRGLEAQLQILRFLGYKGGFISRHRALLSSPLDAAKVASAAGLAAAFSALWYLALDRVTAFWGWVLSFWASALAIGGVQGATEYALAGVIRFRIPALQVGAALPTPFVWWLGVGVIVVLVVGSFLLGVSYLPIVYLLRIVACFQACAQVFFAFWPEAFPYSARGYIETVLIASLMLISLMPILLAFTYYLLDFGLVRNLVLTVVIMGHLTVMVPLQYVTQAWVLHHASLLFLPLLFFVFGLPLNVLVFIALYAYGVSWKNALREPQVQWKLKGRFV
jgi:hypothetical protein